MLIAGIVLLIVAAVVAYLARSERAKARRATATETMACGDIAELSSGVAGEVGGGSFTQRCEAVGVATVGPQGALKGPESGMDAVWTRTKVVHKYWVMEESTSNGRTTRTRQEREETVSEVESEAPFALRDDSGEVVIHPAGADIDRPEQVTDRFDRADGNGGQRGMGGVLTALIRSGSNSGTLGFEHQEWIIRPGARLYVQGEVADRTGALVFEKPRDEGDFLISTRSEEEIVKGARRNAGLYAAGAGVLAVVGLGLLVAGAVA